MLLDKGYVEAYIVIDMLCPCSVPKAWQDDNLWHVSFSDDILVATVRSADACHSNTLRLKHFLPLLRKSSARPKIVNISSSLGSLTKNRENKHVPMVSHS